MSRKEWKEMSRGIFQFQMKIASWNVRGLGGVSRRMVVKELIRRQKLQIVMLQETKLNEVSDATVKQIWGKRDVKWAAVDATGSAGGLLTLWGPCSISVITSWEEEFSLSLLVEDMGNNSRWLLTSVYGPNDNQRRKDFWKELDMIRTRWSGAWCLGGDWNIIRFPSEKKGVAGFQVA